MSRDRHLIDTIKTHFARKSSAQLQEIVQSSNQSRWSLEAMAAAEEILQDRSAGRVQEPEESDGDLSPPSSTPDAFSLAFLRLSLFGPLLISYFVNDLYRVAKARARDRDLPVPFGPQMAWLALDTTDT